MPEYPLCSREEIPAEGEAREIECQGHMVCLANSGGVLTAMDNVCLHRGGPLGQGLIEDGKIICPWHGWAFDLASGAAAHDETKRARIFRTRWDDDMLLITIE